MTTLPTWAVYAVSFGAPAAAFLGALLGHRVVRKGAKELETRSRRDQMMQMLQWAAELAVSADQGKAALGLNQLKAVDESGLTDPDVQNFVTAALESVVEKPAEDLDVAGDDSEAVLTEDEPEDVQSDDDQDDVEDDRGE